MTTLVNFFLCGDHSLTHSLIFFSSRQHKISNTWPNQNTNITIPAHWTLTLSVIAISTFCSSAHSRYGSLDVLQVCWFQKWKWITSCFALVRLLTLHDRRRPWHFRSVISLCVSRASTLRRQIRISISFHTTVIITSAMTKFSGLDKPSLFLIKQVNNVSFLCQGATATDLTGKTLKGYGYFSNGILFNIEDKLLSS